jgi:hypothetical protein
VSHAPGRRPTGIEYEATSQKNIKIIYLYRENPYAAQKGGGSGAVSYRAFHLSGFRRPELDAYRRWADRGFHFFHLEDPRPDLTQPNRTAAEDQNRPMTQPINRLMVAADSRSQRGAASDNFIEYIYFLFY